MGDESTFQPFDRTGLLRRAAPFVGAMWLALVIYPLPPHGGDSDAFVTAVALNVIILVSVLIVPWRRLGPMAGVFPPLAYLLVIVTFFIVINLAVDVLYSALDPRVRLTESKG